MTALYHAYTQTIADGTATSVVRPSDWNSAHIQGQTLSGNTAGASSFTGTNFVLQGGNNVTLSAATAAGAATIIISGANTVAQTVQTQASGAIAGTGFTSTTTAGTALTAALGTNGLSMAVPQFITTYVNDLTSGRAGTGFTSTTTAGTAITAALGTNGLSMAVPNYLTTSSQSVQTQASGAIAGTGFTSTTTAGTAVVATQGTNGLSMAVPAYITTYVNDLTSGRAGTGFTSTTTAGTAITAALGTNGLSMAVPAYLTTFVAQTQQPMYFSASGTSTSANTLQFGNSNGVSFSLTNGSVVGSVNTAYAGLNETTAATNAAISLLLGTDGVALSVNVLHDDFAAWNLLGNTAGTTGTTLTTQGALYLQGGNNITLSGNSNTIVVSAGAGGGTTNQTGPNIGVSNLGNTAGTTGTVSTGNVVFVGSNGIVLSQSIGAGSTGATVSIAAQPLFAWANNLYQVNSQTIQPRQSTSVVFPGFINNAVTFDHIRLPLTVSMNSTTVGTTANTSFSLGVFYTFNVGFYTTNTANASSLGSVLTTTAGMTHQISVQAGTAGSQYTVTNAFTYPANVAGGTSSFSTSYNVSTSNLALSTTQLTQFTGMKHLELAMASSLPANMYWINYGVSSTTSTQGNAGISTNFLIHSNWGMSQPNNTWGFFGQANNASVQAISGVGSFSTGFGGIVAGFGFSNISSSASHVVPYVYMEFDG